MKGGRRKSADLIMKNIYGVIGCNWGDEGKGRITDLLAEKAIQEGSAIVVLSNGSAQRGHTVIRDGKRHVFKHFGAGTIVCADSYFPKNFIVNPYIYEEESIEMFKSGIKKTQCYVHKDCRMALCYDMMENQVVELSRTDKHGSCGCGVWATIQRYQNGYKCNKSVGEIKDMTDEELRQYIERCALYSRNRTIEILHEECLPFKIFESYDSLWLCENLASEMMATIRRFLDEVEIVDDSSFLEDYKTVIFENGQGLMLDYNVDTKFSTPSRTGLQAIKDVLDDNVNYDGIIPEIHYVTRTYITRHGCSEFEGKCEKHEINPDMIETTNVFNPYQRDFHYGKLNYTNLHARVMSDANSCSGLKVKYGFAVTHTSEYRWNDKNLNPSMLWMKLD